MMSSASNGFKISRKRSNTSRIWEHYTEVLEGGKKFAQCNYCPKKYIKNGTGTLLHHTKNSHKEKLNRKDNQTVLRQNSGLDQVVKADDKSTRTQFTENKHLHYIAAMIVSNNHSFTMVEELFFQQLLATSHSNLQLINANTMKRKLYSSFLLKRVEVMKYLQKNSGKVSFTTDVWTSSNSTSYMAVTAFWLDSNFKPYNVVIGFKEMIGPHNAENIYQVFIDVIETFSVEVNFVTTDNASSNSTFIKKLANSESIFLKSFTEDNWIRCTGHIVNLVVQEAMSVLTEPVNKLRSLIKAARSSSQLLEKFSSISKSKSCDLKPVLDVCTRWNSSYLMIERALKLREVFDDICSLERDLWGFELTDNEWQDIQNIEKFLKPFSEIRGILEASCYPTLNLIVPLFNLMLRHIKETEESLDLSDHIIKAAEKARVKLLFYSKKKNPKYLIPVALDPRLKAEFFKQGYNFEKEILPRLKSEYETYQTATQPKSSLTSTIDDILSSRSSSSVTESLFSLPHKKTVNVCEELQSYLNVGLENIGKKPEDILEYWKSNSSKWPTLGSMARDYLSVPATSSSSERSVSVGSDLQSLSRQNLSPQMMEALLCLRSWLRVCLVKPEQLLTGKNDPFEETEAIEGELSQPDPLL